MMQTKEKPMADEAAISELREKMAQGRERLLQSFRSLSEEEASTPPKPEEWTAKEQMAHLCEMETVFREWVKRAVADDGANLDSITGTPVPVTIEQANKHTVAELATEMVRQRQETLKAIAAFKPEHYDHPDTNSVFGTLTVLQWLRSYYRHDRMHYDQVQGEESSFKPRYAGGIEPEHHRPEAG
jgi:uncharacterized damage-inducible protein DinB